MGPELHETVGLAELQVGPKLICSRSLQSTFMFLSFVPASSTFELSSCNEAQVKEHNSCCYCGHSYSGQHYGYDEWLLASMLRVGITAARRAEGFSALARLVRRIPSLDFPSHCFPILLKTNLALAAAQSSRAPRYSLAVDRSRWQQAGGDPRPALLRRPIRSGRPPRRTGGRSRA